MFIGGKTLVSFGDRVVYRQGFRVWGVFSDSLPLKNVAGMGSRCVSANLARRIAAAAVSWSESTCSLISAISVSGVITSFYTEDPRNGVVAAASSGVLRIRDRQGHVRPSPRPAVLPAHDSSESRPRSCRRLARRESETVR